MSAVVQQTLPGIPPEPSNILDIISRAASDPNIDVAKTEKLLEMYERIASRNAEMAFNISMKATQEELPKILRNKTNDTTHSRYADLERVNEQIIPVYTKNGFSLSFGTADCPIKDYFRITCLVSHVAGHSRSYQADIPIDMAGLKGNVNKTPMHGFGSTMSYGRRYMTLLIFNITLTNDDNDGNGHAETISPEQVADIKALLTEVNADQKAFMKWARIDSLDEILAKNYSEVIRTIEAKRKRS